MTIDPMDLLDKGGDTPAPTVTPPAPSQEAPEASPLPPVSEPTAAEPTRKPPWTAAMALDEREKRQRIQAEYEELKRRYEEATAKPKPEIDIFADPEAYKQSIQAEVEQAKWDAITTWSLESATEKHGAQALKEAQDAVQSEMQRNPAFFQTIRSQRHPYDFVVKWHKRQQAIAKLGDDDPDSWFEKQAKERGYILASEASAHVAAPSPTTTPLPRASLASAPSASGNVPKTPVGPGAAFDEAFKK